MGFMLDGAGIGNGAYGYGFYLRRRRHSPPSPKRSQNQANKKQPPEKVTVFLSLTPNKEFKDQ